MAEKATLIIFSGDLDKVLAAFNIATGAVSMNMEVSMFFTFWGLNILKKKKGRKAGSGSFLQKMFNIMMGGRNNLPLSKFNFAGLGPELMKMIMKSKGVKDVEGMLADAVSLGASVAR